MCKVCVAFCGMAFNQTYKSLYILGVHEDNEMIFMLGFFTQNVFFSCFCDLTSQIIRMTSQMVFALLIKKTTLVTLNMLKLTYPK